MGALYFTVGLIAIFHFSTHGTLPGLRHGRLRGIFVQNLMSIEHKAEPSRAEDVVHGL